MITLTKLWALVRLGRPLFLLGGFLFYGLGAAVAVHAGAEIEPARYALGQLAVTAFQLMTHYANDYFDLEADRANDSPTRWSGGSRVLPAGELPSEAALMAALACAALGLGATGALAVAAQSSDGWGAAPALLLAGLLAWAYSAPPLRLLSTGLGELNTAVVVTGLVPWIGFQLQAPALAGWQTLLAAIAPLCLLQLAMLIAIGVPDAAGDAATGKRTLVVRLGGRRSLFCYGAVTGLAFCVLPLLPLLGLPAEVALAAGLMAPLAIWRIGASRTSWAQGARHRRNRNDELAFWAVALLVGTGAAELLAFLWLTVPGAALG